MVNSFTAFFNKYLLHGFYLARNLWEKKISSAHRLSVWYNVACELFINLRVFVLSFILLLHVYINSLEIGIGLIQSKCQLWSVVCGSKYRRSKKLNFAFNTFSSYFPFFVSYGFNSCYFCLANQSNYNNKLWKRFTHT